VLTHHLSWTTKYSKQQDDHESSSMLLDRALCSVYGAGYWKPRTRHIHVRNLMISPVPSPQHVSSILPLSPIESPHISPRSQHSSPMNSPRSTDDRQMLKKFCRVIVVGNQHVNVRPLLYALSYMLRSEDIMENDYSIIEGQVSDTPMSTPPPSPLSTKVNANIFERASLSPFRFVQMGYKAHNVVDKRTESDHIVPPPIFTHINQDPTRARNKFGHALYGDMCTWYCGAMVLMGLPKSVDFIEEAVSDLKLTQNERMDGDDETPDVSCLIIADIDDSLVNVISSSKQHGIKFDEASTSKHVHETLMNMISMKNLFDDETCEAYLDDRLRELYTKAQTLVCVVDDIVQRRLRDLSDVDLFEPQKSESTLPSMLQRVKPIPQLVIDSPKSISIASPIMNEVPKLTYKELASCLDVAVSDVPLLLSIVSTFRADVLNLVCKTKSS
jgi:hypothetical protein